MPTEPTEPTQPTRPQSSSRAASPGRPGGSAAPPEVTATVAPRRASRTARTGTGARSVASAAVPAGGAGPVAAPLPAVQAPPIAATPAPPPAPPSGGDLRNAGTRHRQRPPLHPGQVVCWQLAAGVVAASVGRAWWTIAAAVITGLALVALTGTWRRDRWTYQWAALALGRVVRDPRFVPVEAFHGTLEVGDADAAILVRPDGLTVLLEVGVPPESLPPPSTLLEQHTDLRAKLLIQRDRAWIALTAPRTAGCHRDAELELLLANAVRRLVERLRRGRVPTVPLESGELTEVLARSTPDHAYEDWNGLRLWSGRYRMYAVPLDGLGAAIPPCAVTVTVPDDLDHALLLAPAGAPPIPGSVPLTGRQRSAFITALP